MTRHAKIGLITAVIFIIIMTPIGLLSWNHPHLNSIGQLLVLPAFPVIYVFVQIFPPPMGESEICPWDYMVLSVALVVSAIIWGVIAGLLSRYVFKKRDNAAEKVGDL